MGQLNEASHNVGMVYTGFFLPKHTSGRNRFADEKERKARTLLLMALFQKDQSSEFSWHGLMPKRFAGSYQDKQEGQRVDGNMHAAFDREKFECFNCHNTWAFCWECTSLKVKGSEEAGTGRGQDFQASENEKEL
ncbi:hypothetical protein Tco_0968822 [Tanacetum coccineum]